MTNLGEVLNSLREKYTPLLGVKEVTHIFKESLHFEEAYGSLKKTDYPQFEALYIDYVTVLFEGYYRMRKTWNEQNGSLQ